MASPARVGNAISLEKFLRMPEIDEHPYLEYIDGRIEAKVSQQKRHSRIEAKLVAHLDAYAEPRELGSAFMEIRCTFAGYSLVPDVVFLLEEHIEIDEDGEIHDLTLRSPDIHVEILSPDEPVRRCREKLVISTANGCPLGWLIDPERKTVEVYRSGRPSERLPADGVLKGGPVLPRYRLPVVKLFGWLVAWQPNPPSPQSQSGPSAPGDSP
jgi:Uma2 family endonuclease